MIRAVQDARRDLGVDPDAVTPVPDTGPAVEPVAIGAPRARRSASFWKVWLPIPIVFVLLDVTFNLYFWKIPHLRGDADYGYQFLLDEHRMADASSGALRVLAFGSSVSASFDYHQVETLLGAAHPGVPIEVHRLMKPGIKPADYRLLFESEELRMRPDVAVVMFNLLDFLHPSFERSFRPAVREALPPWSILRESYSSIPTLSEKLDLLLASVSNLYRYRTLIRSALRDHIAAAWQWLRSRPTKGPYGWYADGYTRQRVGVPVGTGAGVELEYYVDPEWIRQRGVVTLRFAAGRQVLEHRVETEPGWKTVALTLPPGAPRIVDVAADSAWSPRAGGQSLDARLLAVRLRQPPPAPTHDGDRPPFRYPPFDDRDIQPFLRMGDLTGAAFSQRWDEVLNSKTAFGTRFRAYRDSKLAIRNQPFEPTGEYAEIARLVDHLARQGTFVILLNTPESPWILNEYQDTPYYRAYLAFFAELAKRHPNVRFADLRSALPPEDFNDWHHANYIGGIKLGTQYEGLVSQAIRELQAQRASN